MNFKFAPRETFEVILEWSVIPTFDLLIEYGDQGVVFVKRVIEPYKNNWALPGLRMYKGESIKDTLRRIAKQELGLIIDPDQCILIGQYVGKFKTERNRQDLSTCYTLRLKGDERIVFNQEHFNDIQITKTAPHNLGAMYRYYFDIYKSSSANRRS